MKSRICDFLLGANFNLGPDLSSFQRYCIQGFLLMTPPLFHPNFGVVPLDLISIRTMLGQPEPNPQNLKLINRKIIFEVFQPA